MARSSGISRDISATRLHEKAEIADGMCALRPQGEASIVEFVDFVRAAIAYCRGQRLDKLLVNAIGIEGLPMPTMVDRFLAAEEWASEAEGMMVAVVLVAHAEYIHPKKFGVKVARELGLMLDVYTSEADALAWLAGNPHLA